MGFYHVYPKLVAVKITIFGKVNRNMLFFNPIYLARIPKRKFPIIAPIEKYEPIQDISFVVIGPLNSGVDSDCNIGRAGDNHPIAPPWHNVIIFAEN